MNTASFESKLLPDGHLYCPKEFSQKKNAFFKVIVRFETESITENKRTKNEDKKWHEFSLSSAMQGMEEEDTPYSVNDIKEVFS
ncbi:MAG: hypothetical protein HQK77_20860 [Desulfobacterales bacterium]|nr:hypothetical protein [Desulfobacterales bacterium]